MAEIIALIVVVILFAAVLVYVAANAIKHLSNARFKSLTRNLRII